MKTYSVAFWDADGNWITNYFQYESLDEINWDEVDFYCTEKNFKGYGYYYGHNSRNLSSSRCRTVLKEF